MAIARVDQGTGGLGAFGSATSGTTVTVNLSQAPVAGNALVAFVAGNTSSNFIKGITGGGVTWVEFGRLVGGGAMVGLWYGVNSTGSGTSIVGTANATISSMTMRMVVAEFSGISISNPEDIKNATNSGTSTSPVTDTVDPVNNIEELFVAVHKGGTVSAGPTNSFTALTDPATSARCAYYIATNTSTNTYSTGWTQANGGWVTAIASLKGAVTSSTPVVIPTLLTMNVG
jgi:hypothetical protein